MGLDAPHKIPKWGPAINSFLDLPKHAIKGLINLSKVRRINMSISNDPHNRLNERENVSASASNLPIRNILNFKILK